MIIDSFKELSSVGVVSVHLTAGKYLLMESSNMTIFLIGGSVETKNSWIKSGSVRGSLFVNTNFPSY